MKLSGQARQARGRQTPPRAAAEKIAGVVGPPIARSSSGASPTGEESVMQKITPFLWFDTQAEEAAKFYVSIFKNAKIGTISRYGEAGPGPKGSVMTVSFELEGQRFTALNGGPHFKFTEAVSLLVDCKSQAEVDELWEKLSAGGQSSRCGWLKDKYDLSWQIIPSALMELLSDPDKQKSQRVMQAMLQMTKIDIAELRRAAAAT
jgi:predicted 3-demethylubiquinone-9 3-methyltransferase (glyoxalase superfamily)